MEQKELYQALAELQQEVGAIQKNEENPHFKHKYFDINQILDQILPIFKERGLLLLQPFISDVEHGIGVETSIIHIETGQKIQSFMPIPAGLTDPQKIGSCITYFRRYSLQTMLGLQAEDDDANTASPKPELQQDAYASEKQKGLIRNLIKEIDVMYVHQDTKDEMERLMSSGKMTKKRASETIGWLQEKKKEQQDNEAQAFPEQPDGQMTIDQ